MHWPMSGPSAPPRNGCTRCGAAAREFASARRADCSMCCSTSAAGSVQRGSSMSRLDVGAGASNAPDRLIVWQRHATQSAVAVPTAQGWQARMGFRPPPSRRYRFLTCGSSAHERRLRQSARFQRRDLQLPRSPARAAAVRYELRLSDLRASMRRRSFLTIWCSRWASVPAVVPGVEG